MPRSRQRGGDRHPQASEGEKVYRMIRSGSLASRTRGGDARTGKFFTAWDMVSWIPEALWTTNTQTLEGRVNHLQTMIGRNAASWQKGWRKISRKWYRTYRNVEHVR